MTTLTLLWVAEYPLATLPSLLERGQSLANAASHLQARSRNRLTFSSAVGKTQFLLTLLASVQLQPLTGLAKAALYISTEAPLQTTRLSQILRSNPSISALESKDRPSLNRIHSTHIHDLEAQEHILRYQVPVVIQRHNIGLIVIDSIAANLRPEFSGGRSKGGGPEPLAQRSVQLQQLGNLLRGLARKHDLAVVVANQVSDRIVNPSTTFVGPSSQPYPPANTPSATQSQRSSQHQSQTTNPQQPALEPQHSAITSAPPSISLSTDDPLSLDHQQCFFSGWGDTFTNAATANLKTPSLGLVWTNQLDMRVALLKEREHGSEAKWKRQMKVAFSSWAKEGSSEFELWEGGVRAVGEPLPLEPGSG